MKIVFAGGDLRQGYCARYLETAGHSVFFWKCQEEALSLTKEGKPLPKDECVKGDILVLPFPLTRDLSTVAGTKGALSLATLQNVLPAFRLVIGGGMPQSFLEKGPLFLDLSAVEDYTLALAHITAEATLSLLLTHTKTTVSRLHLGILGYGRIGRSLAQKCLSLGGKVTVFARGKEKPALAVSDGVHRVEGVCPNSDALSSLSVLVNTVPAPVFPLPLFDSLPEDALLIELATGEQLPKNTGRPLLLGHGLPGKLLPKAAGEVLGQFVLSSITSNT